MIIIWNDDRAYPPHYQGLGHLSDASRKLFQLLPMSAELAPIISDGGTRTLSGASQVGPTNTIESCISFCQSKNFVYAGVEYGVSCDCADVSAYAHFTNDFLGGMLCVKFRKSSHHL